VVFGDVPGVICLDVKVAGRAKKESEFPVPGDSLGLFWLWPGIGDGWKTSVLNVSWEDSRRISIGAAGGAITDARLLLSCGLRGLDGLAESLPLKRYRDVLRAGFFSGTGMSASTSFWAHWIL
jgi:hypothetical protein